MAPPPPPPLLQTWLYYVALRFQYAHHSLKRTCVQFAQRGENDMFFKNPVPRKMTYLYWNEGDPVLPDGIGEVETFLVRKLPIANLKHVSVGDLVVFKNPEKEDDYLVRRLTAIEGHEIVSTNDKHESFALEEGQCWVEAENKGLEPKEAKDSRSFGPVNLRDIVGRAIYRLRTCGDHGYVQNSFPSFVKDYPVVLVELDVEEILKNFEDFED